MSRSVAVIGAPSSAGAYSPGQEKAPDALRRAGLLDAIRASGAEVVDCGNTRAVRWRADRDHPRAMNLEAVAAVAREVAQLTGSSIANGQVALVLGGDCTIEIGTVAGAMADGGRVGLIYFDLDADLNTPSTTSDGALDWMGVAHLLAIDGTEALLANLGPRRPLLDPCQILLFGTRNVKPCEQTVIDELGIAMISGDRVEEDPAAAATKAIDWASGFDRLLVHFDADAVDFEDFPLAENVRRKEGLSWASAARALKALLQAPNWAALTVAEVNPDHGETDGSTLSEFAQFLGQAVAAAPALKRDAGPVRAPPP